MLGKIESYLFRSNQPQSAGGGAFIKITKFNFNWTMPVEMLF